MSNNSLDQSAKIQQKKLDNESEQNRLKHDLYKHLYSPQTFAFLLILLIVVAGLVVAARWNDVNEVKSFWSIITPLVSTYIGFAIGGAFKERG